MLKKRLAELKERANKSGDAGSLLAAQFQLADDLAQSIYKLTKGGGIAPAAYYRELRMTLADIVAVIAARENKTQVQDRAAALAELLGN